MDERKEEKIICFSSSVRQLIIVAMDRLVERFLFGALEMVVFVVAVAAWVMAVQVLREYCLSVFFASMNSWDDCDFD